MERPDVLVFRPVMPKALEQLNAHFTVHKLWEQDDPEAYLATVSSRVRAIAGGPAAKVDKAVIDNLPGLEIVANFGVGYDSVDAVYCGKNGIVVTNTPDVLTDEVADTALGLLIMTARELSATEQYLRAGKWAAEGPYPLTRGTLRGRKLGILALGRIGKAIAARAEVFGLEIHYHGRNKQSDVAYTYHPTLLGMAQTCDTLMSVAPGGDATFHLIDKEILEALGPDGILINVGRGSVVDEAALIEALQKKSILAAGLDVFENEPKVPAELIALDNAVLLPHVASASIHTRNAMGQLMVDNLISWFAERKVLTPVPETPVP